MATLKPMVVSVKIRSEAEVKAEALREMADLIYTDGGPDHPLSVATWLRERAAMLEGEG